ncbi:Histidine kinase domain-containing protein [Acanthopleuribacter pedis]
MLALNPQKLISQYIHKHWSLEEGLSQVTVQAILQCDDGYLWLGTQEGLVRFDGWNMRVFDRNQEPKLENDFINGLFQSAQGDLWVGTRRGVVRFRESRLVSFRGAAPQPRGNIAAFSEDAEGRVWLGGDDGLWVFENEVFRRVPLPFANRARLPVTQLLNDSMGRLWIATDRGLLRKEARATIQVPLPGTTTASRINALFLDEGDRVWVGTNEGLFDISSKGTRRYTREEGLTSDRILALQRDQNGVLWVGTSGGLNRFFEDELLPDQEFYPLRNHQISAIHHDRESNLWVGTYNDGLHQLRDGLITCVGRSEGLPHDSVRALLENPDGSIWMGTAGGLGLLRGSQVVRHAIRPADNDIIVQTLMRDDRDNLWIGTRFSGVLRYHQNRYDVIDMDFGLSDNYVRALLQDREGRIWIGTAEGGIDVLFRDQLTNMSVAQGLSSPYILTLFQDRLGAVWVGTRGGGVNRIYKGTIETFTTADGLTGDTIYNFFEDVEGKLWIGTDEGLSLYHQGVFRGITTEQGLFNHVVYSITEDRGGRFWMTCNKGIYSVRRQECEAVIQGRKPLIHCRVYGVPEGMRSPECNFGGPSSGIQTTVGELWFPTVSGAVRIDPAQKKLNWALPPVRVERVVADNRLLDREGAQVGPRLEQIELSYTALSFSEPEKVLFRTRLEGFDLEWKEQGSRRFANYTNLAPGEYTFRVVACNNDGLWNLDGASFNFEVKPSFTQTYTFYALVVVALALVGYGLIRLRLHGAALREERLHRLVEARTFALKQANTDLVQAQERLVQAAHQAGMAEIATNVLHNIGNALNSVNVTTSLIGDQLRTMNIGFLERLVLLLGRHKDNMVSFLVDDPRGRHVPRALGKIAESLLRNKQKLLADVASLEEQVLRINNLIRQQQAHIDNVHFLEIVHLGNLLDEVLHHAEERIQVQDIRLEVSCARLSPIRVHKSKLVQVLLYLIDNAIEAMEVCSERKLTITAGRTEDKRVFIEVVDTGVGIDPEIMDRIFFHSFSTKPDVNGYGLHYSANAMMEMGGNIRAFSDGVGRGARFRVELPYIEVDEETLNASNGMRSIVTDLGADEER